MVRAARLQKTMKRRPEAKGVLLALADRCDDDGRNAWPSVETIAAEAEIGKRTADACLVALRDHGIIAEQARPRQHQPRTWRLNLDVVATLADAQHTATLNESSDTHDPATLPSPDAQHTATLQQGERRDWTNSDTQNQASDTQGRELGSQKRALDTQTVATDPVLLNCPLNDPLNKVPAAQAPRSPASVTNEDRTRAFLKGFAVDVVDELGSDDRGQLTRKLQVVADERYVACDSGMLAEAIAFALRVRRFGRRVTA